jgi:hypothetical protein
MSLLQCFHSYDNEILLVFYWTGQTGQLTGMKYK